MMHKSKFADSCFEHSTANASWDDFENQIQATSTLARPAHSPSLGRVPPSVRSLLLRTRPHEEKSAAAIARDENRLSASPRKRQRRTNLIDPEKIHRLLDMLRSDGFAGKIDIEHHSHYFEPPLSESRLIKNNSPPRHQSLSQLTAARKHYFEEALQRPSKMCSRSHAAFVGK